MENELFLKAGDKGIVFKVYIQPRASKNSIAGIYKDAIKIRLTAPPVDNAANKMCIAFLSRCLKYPKSSIEIVSGHTSRNKTICCHYKNSPETGSEKKKLIQIIKKMTNGKNIA
ncbi:DUF167 domain-containing protein [Desulfobacterales bacterium HSG16]|nr:DUF167 domain-containing protein [Desulfobacterales bacterium HSG16]